MKYFLMFSFFIIVSTACNNPKNTTASKKVSYWKPLSADKTPIKYSSFIVYSLDESSFLKALENGDVVMPDDLGNLNTFTIVASKTMAAELAEKFPTLKSFKGKQIDNNLCQARIERTKSKIKISVLCNDKTYFIDKDKELSLFVVYNKGNAPKGTGTVNE